ncbi:hypothetical protein PHISCL_02893 [Aspergillus sclerotialis]|uniref:Uncharacterized protein n=1 Tax=Aspergillus sclerotialis TaxID=2070753 RepID=A0A3A2ZNE0_9EURO|nr:hypothetical protein PHISCL_02893 [Aspergillus sclerotialis]
MEGSLKRDVLPSHMIFKSNTTNVSEASTYQQSLHVEQDNNHKRPENANANSGTSSLERSINVRNVSYHNSFHPWGIVDYHLLLASVERGTLNERRNCMYLLNEDKCIRVLESELFDNQHFGPLAIKRNPKLLFSILPITERTQNGQPFFGIQHYILGFDCNTRVFFARRFSAIPEDMTNIWNIWDQGNMAYSVSVFGLLELLDARFSGNYRVDRGILSSSGYCMSQHKHEPDDPGLELTIVIQFCQWIIDCVDLVFVNDDEWLMRYTIAGEFNVHMETCRLILHRASYRAWFAFRKGTAIADYKQNLIIEIMANDLCLFKDTADINRLRDQVSECNTWGSIK